MRKTTLLAAPLFLITLATSAPAEAQENAGIGIGIESILTSEFGGVGNSFPGVATITYDTGNFYASGLLTFANVDDTVTIFGIGGRFYFPVHDGDRSDFALGGGFGIMNTDVQGASETDTSFHLEAGGRLRAWITSNVALNAGVGIGILVADDDGGPPDENAIGLVGNLMGSLGISYFFW